MTSDSRPNVLFVCVHNAGRSQMALGFFRHYARDRAVVWSGGSEPANVVNPVVVAAMRERGIDISGEFPKPWTEEIVRAADVVVTMGCGDICPVLPGKRYEEGVLDDPAGRDLAGVRPIRDAIDRRVRGLLDRIGVTVAARTPEVPMMAVPAASMGTHRLTPRQYRVLQAVADGRVQRDLLLGSLEPHVLDGRDVIWPLRGLVLRGLVRIRPVGPPTVTRRGRGVLDSRD